MTWEIRLTPPAARELRRLDGTAAGRVLAALDRFAMTERDDVRQLRGRSGELRLRVGGWRVTYEEDREAQAIIVHHVLPRGRAYRR